MAINRVADWTDSHDFRFSVEKSHAVLFRRTRRLFSEPSLNLYSRPLSVVSEIRFLGMTFDERLTGAPHPRSVRLEYQSLLDLPRHLSHTTCGADRITLLRVHLVFFRSKLDYGAYVYCGLCRCFS